MPTQKELIDQATKEYGIGGDNSEFFRFEKNGTYRLRVLTQCYPMATYFLGKGIKPKIAYSGMPKQVDAEGNEVKPSVKFVGYVIDREDGKIKIAELPYTIIKNISAYQEDEDYHFADFPMPYDVKITYNKEAAASDMYKSMPAPKHEPLTEEEKKAFAEKMGKITPEQYVEKRKDKEREKQNAEAVYEGVEPPQTDYPTDEYDGEQPPF